MEAHFHSTTQHRAPNPHNSPNPFLYHATSTAILFLAQKPYFPNVRTAAFLGPFFSVMFSIELVEIETTIKRCHSFSFAPTCSVHFLGCTEKKDPISKGTLSYLLYLQCSHPCGHTQVTDRARDLQSALMLLLVRCSCIPDRVPGCPGDFCHQHWHQHAYTRYDPFRTVPANRKI